MKRTLILTLAIGAVAVVGVGAGMHAAQSGHRGDGYGSWHRGSYAGMDGERWGGHGRGHRWKGKHRRMKRMLKRFDTNKDGKLTQAEIDDARKALVTKHDANGDGQLTLAEFQNLWLEVRNRRMVRSFQRIDEDGDAVVSVEEFLEPFSNVVARLDRNDDGVLDKNDRRKRFGWRHHRRHGDDKSDNNQTEGEATQQ